MRIVHERPPLFDLIVERFPRAATQAGVVFAWGDLIFNPDRVTIPPEILAHEAVHGRRQGTDPQSWWARYLADAQFCLGEELAAHQAEYQHLRARLNDRNAQARALHNVAARLASPLYGGLVSHAEARGLVRGTSSLKARAA